MKTKISVKTFDSIVEEKRTGLGHTRAELA
jgi:hypothetical protein